MHAICFVDALNAFGASTEFIRPKAFIYLDLREKLFSLNGKLNISVISVFSFQFFFCAMHLPKFASRFLVRSIGVQKNN